MYILALGPVPVLLAALHIRQLTLPCARCSSKQALPWRRRILLTCPCHLCGRSALRWHRSWREERARPLSSEADHLNASPPWQRPVNQCARSGRLYQGPEQSSPEAAPEGGTRRLPSAARLSMFPELKPALSQVARLLRLYADNSSRGAASMCC